MEEPIDTGDVVTDEELRMAMAWHLGGVVELEPNWSRSAVYMMGLIDVTIMMEQLFDKGLIERSPAAWVAQYIKDWDKD